MFRLILQTQARLGGFSVLSHLLSPKVKSTLLSTNDLQCAVSQIRGSGPINKDETLMMMGILMLMLMFRLMRGWLGVRGT